MAGLPEKKSEEVQELLIETSLRTLDSLRPAVAVCSESILWTSDAALPDAAQKLGVAHRLI